LNATTRGFGSGTAADASICSGPSDGAMVSAGPVAVGLCPALTLGVAVSRMVRVEVALRTGAV